MIKFCKEEPYVLSPVHLQKKSQPPVFYLFYMTHSFQTHTEYTQCQVELNLDTSALRSNPVE